MINELVSDLLVKNTDKFSLSNWATIVAAQKLQTMRVNEHKEDLKGEVLWLLLLLLLLRVECRKYSTYVTALDNSPYTSTRANTSPSPEVWDPYNALCIRNNVCRSSFSRD